MLTLTPGTFDADTVARELLSGGGAVRIAGVYTPAQIDEARSIVMTLSDTAPNKVTHFNADADDTGKLHLQRRVWSLFGKGEIFPDLVTHPIIMQSMSTFLGSEFTCGSYCASRLLPGCPGQEPHIDYPYWDLYRRESFPMAINASFPMNAQGTILLDPFTEASGATAYLPGTQETLRYPREADVEEFFASCQRMTGDPGDLVFFFGAAWHCAMPNRSNHDRTGLLIEFLPKFVKPVEDLTTGLSQGFLDQASPEVRQLLGLTYPYPELFDLSSGGNEIGRADQADRGAA